jgi:hypothetical protein
VAAYLHHRDTEVTEKDRREPHLSVWLLCALRALW